MGVIRRAFHWRTRMAFPNLFAHATSKRYAFGGSEQKDSVFDQGRP